MHDPGHVDAVAKARRLGGRRRRREVIVATEFDFEGFHSMAQIQRFLNIAAFQVLSLEPSVARARAMTAIAQTAIRLLEVGELVGRVESLEAAVRPRSQAVGSRR